MLHGRDVERLRLAALTLGARQGRAGVLMVLGEPGVGKSALLDELTGSAADQGMRVLRTVGLESESPLAFGALHRDLLGYPRSNALGEQSPHGTRAQASQGHTSGPSQHLRLRRRADRPGVELGHRHQPVNGEDARLPIQPGRTRQRFR